MSKLAADIAIVPLSYVTRRITMSDFENSIIAPEQVWPPSLVKIKPVEWLPELQEIEKEVTIKYEQSTTISRKSN